MAFQVKTDYCGLATAITNLTVKDSTLNGSSQKYQPLGQDGSILATEVYGADSAPSNNYGVASNVTASSGTIQLGAVLTQGTDKYALESVRITTAAAAAPSVSATCQQIESAATDSSACHYSVPAFSLTTKQHAQILFSAFTLTGEGCSLTACDADIRCTVGKSKIAGSTIASDINTGVIVVTGTVIQTGSTAPTITAATGWTITRPIAPTESNGETSYKTYQFTVEQVLAKDVAST